LNWAKIEKIKSPENSGLKDGILAELFNTYQLNIED
jgi:hypothetical protein